MAIKLSGKTLDILKNFQNINPSLAFRPGNKLSTISISKKVIAIADVEETFDTEFGIYELNKLFGAISLFKDPAIRIEKHMLNLSEGKRNMYYITCDTRDIITPSENTPTELPSVDVEFVVTERMIKDALKAASILNQPNLVFEGNGTNVVLSTQHIGKPTNESYTEDVGGFTGGEKPFKIILKTENIHLMPGDYTVRISFKKIIQFTGAGVTYFVAAEKDSVVSK